MNAFNDWRKLHEIIVASTEALFESNGIQPRYAGVVPANQTEWEPIVSMVSFRGPELQGTLVLSVPPTALQQSNPVPVDPDPYDWLTELANLLLGRVKRELVVRGAPSDVSTPTTLSACGARLAEFSDRSVVLAFEVPSETIYVAFDAEWARKDTDNDIQYRGETLKLGEVVVF